MKSILIGSVGSSRIILEEMIQMNFPLEMVFSLDEKYSKNVSGYYPIHELASNNGIATVKFNKINETKYINAIKKINPDYIFVIGLSQLVSKEIIDSAKIGVIGFHPTPLPKFRGRAAIAWQILLGVTKTKCSLFFIDEKMDSGDIIGQEEYIIGNEDYAMDVLIKCQEALKKLLRWTLPLIINESIETHKQNEDDATYLLKRTPEDGRVRWNQSLESIQRLIRASSIPYPGAFSYYKGKSKVIFWKADYEKTEKIIGVNGQIAKVTEEYIEIVCEGGILRVFDFENIEKVKLVEGNKFK